MKMLMGPAYHPTKLSGWGLTAPSNAFLGHVRPDELASAIESPSERGVIMRGLGRSYGDPAQNSGGRVLTLETPTSGVRVDEDAGTVWAGAGVSLHDLLLLLVPLGFFVPVTPGTRFVSVGGAVASDIHGKNHHLEGSFGNHVQEIELLVADGTVRLVSPVQDAEIFWATVGGMGLTGVILSVRFRLLRIESSQCVVSTRRCENIDSLMALMTQSDDDYRYSVAWTDLLATGRHLGRSVLWRGDHAKVDELDPASRRNPLLYAPRHLASIPPVVPAPGFVNPLSSRLFSEFWFRRAPKRRDGEMKSIAAFFHPLDAIGRWNQLYGRAGFVQYQFVVPFSQGEILKRIVERFAQAKVASPLVVLKRFGAANQGFLSFPMPGWTLTVDIPAGIDHLASLLHEIDEMVLSAGGRHYLAKDAHMTAEALRRGYPRLGEWQSIQKQIDPQGRWQSDQARRLSLIERTVHHE